MERKNLTSSAVEHIVVVARIAIMEAFKLYSFKYSSYDVDAVISDNLYKVSNYLWEYDESRSRSAWFYKIASRCASSYMKSEYNWRYHHRGMATKSVNDDEIVELELADREGSRRDQPDFQIIVNEVMESVDKVIDTFGDKAALALRLYAEGYSCEEMQERLGMGYLALKTLIYRYRKELKERLDSIAA